MKYAGKCERAEPDHHRRSKTLRYPLSDQDCVWMTLRRIPPTWMPKVQRESESLRQKDGEGSIIHGHHRSAHGSCVL